MMRQKIIHLLYLAALLALNTTTAQNLPLNHSVQNIVTHYRMVCNDSCYEASRNYFDSFPCSFRNFRKIFGYEESIKGKVEYGDLYSESINYITMFFQMNEKIPLDDFSEKIINLCIDGEWQSDGVNYFYINVVNIVTSSTLCHDCYYNYPQFHCYNDTIKNALLFQLVQHNDDEILSFWRFYLDHSFVVPIDHDLYNLTRIIIQDYPIILTEQLDKAYSNYQSQYSQ